MMKEDATGAPPGPSRPRWGTFSLCLAYDFRMKTKVRTDVEIGVRGSGEFLKSRSTVWFFGM